MSLNTNMTSPKTPDAPDAQGVDHPRLTQEFSHKNNLNRFKISSRGFSGSLNANILSAMTHGASGAQGVNQPWHFQELLHKSNKKIGQKLIVKIQYSGAF